MLKKIIYFDEGSATDFLLLKNGGNLLQETKGEKETGTNTETTGKASISAGKGIKKLLSFLAVDIEAEGAIEGSLYRNSEKLVKTSITNTILNDFVDYSIAGETEQKEIKVLDNYSIKFAYNSVAYLQRVTPFLTMTDDKIPIDSELEINAKQVHDTVKSSKGYYEVIAYKKGEEDLILRFNNESFRNNYSIAELDQMDLQFFGVRVGRMSKELLNIDLMFEEYSDETHQESEEVNYVKELLGEQEDEFITQLYEVYDILLAGVD